VTRIHWLKERQEVSIEGYVRCGYAWDIGWYEDEIFIGNEGDAILGGCW
jgi:hypothetical protein